MSANPEDDKEPSKALPLDLARTQLAAVRSVETSKAPIVMTSQALRSVRVLTQGVPVSSSAVSMGQTIITNIVPGAVIKPDALQRPTQITLSAPIVASQTAAGTSYHVPRGPAVVANLAAPRSNVTTVRAPLVVTCQTNPTFVRPPRTLSPAQGPAWLATNAPNVSQLKTTPTVLSSPVRATAGKQQAVPRSQPMSTIRSGTILPNAITIGPTVHTFKPATVTLAQMVPAKPQAVVYNNAAQFTPAARITITTTAQSQIVRPSTHPKTVSSIISGNRITVPINHQNTRMITPSTTQRGNTQQPVLANTTARLVTAQPTMNVVRPILTTVGSTGTSNNILTSQARISTLSTLNLQGLMAVTNGGVARVQQTTQGPKVIAQSAAIHLTQLKGQSSTIITTTASRTINVPASIVTQRSSSSQSISIAKVLATTENQASTTSVFIHAPIQRHPSPSSLQTTPTTTAPYSLVNREGSYFYENSSSAVAGTPTGAFQRPFVSQSQSFVPSGQQVGGGSVRAAPSGMRASNFMVLDQGRSSQFQTIPVGQSQESVDHQNKTTASPRPSILRKRDHEGSPLKAARNLSAVLHGLNQSTTSPPSSPPPRSDSRGNGHSSGGSTTMSATSSPELPEANEDSNSAMLKEEEEEEEVKPPIEMSPRKKPRKQQLTGNDMDENHGDMQFISESGGGSKKEQQQHQDDSDGPSHSDTTTTKNGEKESAKVATLRKPAASLLNGYRQTWKSTHNHYMRHSDVKPKEEKKATIIDLANQSRVVEKVNGWKIFHLSTQMEDLAEQEQSVYDQLNDLLKITESEESFKQYDRELNRVNELIKGNLQRIKIINDGMRDAKSQIMKVFDHQRHVNDILSRCASKRNFKKREKS